MHYSEEAQIADGPLPGSLDSRAIDASLRLPVLALFGNAVHWLIVSALIAVVLSIKLVIPEFLGGISFLSYGRLAPVARDLFLYGWASQAALAAGIWLSARLAGRPLSGSALGSTLQSTLMMSATVLWNLAVLLGSLALLCGYSTGVEWLEYPGWASGALFASFLMIGIWALLLFDRRVGERVEVAQWYLVAGLCSFPWIYGTANLLLVWKPIAASAQGPVQAWFGGSFALLWLLPISMGALYAMLPRMLAEHLHRRNLASFGFWSFLFLGGWSGMTHLIAGPVPAWMTAVGIVAGVLFLIPVIIVAINLLGMPRHDIFGEGEKPTGIPERFLFLGLSALIVLGAVTAISSVPLISGALSFTGVTEAKTQLLLLGAVSLPLFGILYEALPHLLGRESWCPSLSERHYWLTLVGFWLLTGSLALGGLFTGLALNDSTISFLNITSYAYPFYVLECVAQLILLAAAIMIGFNLTRAFAGDYLFPKR
jgi:cytochrome c oxidase cbb3-type subunit 1